MICEEITFLYAILRTLEHFLLLFTFTFKRFINVQDTFVVSIYNIYITSSILLLIKKKIVKCS